MGVLSLRPGKAGSAGAVAENDSGYRARRWKLILWTLRGAGAWISNREGAMSATRSPRRISQ